MDKVKRIATVGTFDGLHRGHREVLRTLTEEARRRGLSPVVMTFDRHPLETVAPERAPKLLLGINRRDQLLRLEGTDVIRLEFNEELRNLSAQEWMTRLARDYNVAAIVIGYDNTFGSDGVALTIADFRRIGNNVGMDIIEAPTVPGCSSSGARKALITGDIKTARDILGHPFSISGQVVHGKGVGRTIGFPTANLHTDSRQLIPGEGVYAATAVTPFGEYPAVVNIGRAPTIKDGAQTTVEAHLLDFKGDLYGQSVDIIFGPRLRDEQKFPSVKDLRARIAADIEAAGKICPKTP